MDLKYPMIMVPTKYIEPNGSGWSGDGTKGHTYAVFNINSTNDHV